MSADLQELLLSPPARFLKMVENLIVKLDSLHRRIFPTMCRRIDDHSDGQLDDIRAFIDDVEVQLKMVVLLRNASALMVPRFSENDKDDLHGLLDILAQFEEELQKAVEWLYGVLDKYGEETSELEDGEIREEDAEELEDGEIREEEAEEISEEE